MGLEPRSCMFLGHSAERNKVNNVVSWRRLVARDSTARVPTKHQSDTGISCPENSTQKVIDGSPLACVASIKYVASRTSGLRELDVCDHVRKIGTRHH